MREATPTDTDGAIWRTSANGDDDGVTVQVAFNLVQRTGRILVRSSTPGGSVLSFTPAEWDAFTAGVRDGELTLPPDS